MYTFFYRFQQITGQNPVVYINIHCDKYHTLKIWENVNISKENCSPHLKNAYRKPCINLEPLEPFFSMLF